MKVGVRRPGRVGSPTACLLLAARFPHFSQRAGSPAARRRGDGPGAETPAGTETSVRGSLLPEERT